MFRMYMLCPKPKSNAFGFGTVPNPKCILEAAKGVTFLLKIPFFAQLMRRNAFGFEMHLGHSIYFSSQLSRTRSTGSVFRFVFLAVRVSFLKNEIKEGRD